MKNIVDGLNTKDIAEIGMYSTPAKIMKYLVTQLEEKPKVIEIGTGYGDQLPHFGAGCSKLICVDAMYNWVPDLTLAEGHDTNKFDQKKFDNWTSHVEPFKDTAQLVIGNSFLVHSEEQYQELFKDTNVLIVDGCHHPAQAVADDYLNFRKFLTNPHYVLFDDMGFSDCRQGSDMCKKILASEGYSVSSVDITNSPYNIVCCLMFVEKK